MKPGPRSCLVCHTKTSSEGQLCPECVEAGHRVENNTLYVNIEVDVPDGLLPQHARNRPAQPR